MSIPCLRFQRDLYVVCLLLAGLLAMPLFGQCEKKVRQRCLETSRLIVGKITTDQQPAEDDEYVDMVLTPKEFPPDTFDLEVESKHPGLMVTMQDEEEGATVDLLWPDSIVVAVGTPVTFRLPVKTEPGLLERITAWTPPIIDPSPPHHGDPDPTSIDCPPDEIKLIECTIGYVFTTWQNEPKSEADPLTGNRFTFPVRQYPLAGKYILENVTEVPIPRCCPVGPVRIRQSIQVIVVEVDALFPDSGFEIDDGDGDPDTRSFVVPVDPTPGSRVIMTAVPNPAVEPEALPPEWMMTGGRDLNRVQQVYRKDLPITWTFRALCGSSLKRTSLHLVHFALEQVLFEATGSSLQYAVTSDSGAPTYNKPVWKDVNFDGDGDDLAIGDRKDPLAYKRGARMQVDLTIGVHPPNPVIISSVKIKGIGPDDLYFPAKEVTMKNGKLEIADFKAFKAFADQVAHYDPLAIEWLISLDSGLSWLPIATSRNKAYLTLEKPKTSPLYETLLYLGCKNAHGESTAAKVAAGAWLDFSKRNLSRVDGTQLRYWWKHSSGVQPYQELAPFLKPDSDPDKNGNGACGAFSKLFKETLRAMGLGGPKLIGVTSIYKNDASNKPGTLLVKRWRFGQPLNPSLASVLKPFTHRTIRIFPEAGAPGQGNADPFSVFDNHYIVRYNGRFYDPSYGGKVYNDQDEWEEASLDGFHKKAQIKIGGKKTTLDVAKTNDPKKRETVFTELDN